MIILGVERKETPRFLVHVLLAKLFESLSLLLHLVLSSMFFGFVVHDHDEDLDFWWRKGKVCGVPVDREERKVALMGRGLRGSCLSGSNFALRSALYINTLLFSARRSSPKQDLY
jgi:hypothetical protein